MNHTLQTALDASIAEITRAVPLPIPPLGYGSDLSCVLDCDDSFTELAVNTNNAIGQAIARRFVTPRGALPDDGNYGLDIRGLCNIGVTDAQVQSLSGLMEGEALKDERVQAIKVTLTFTRATRTLRAECSITPVASTESFRFVFVVTDGQFLVERIG